MLTTSLDLVRLRRQPVNGSGINSFDYRSLLCHLPLTAGEVMERVYLAEDGVHLSHEPARGPATAANLARCGYLGCE